LTRHGASITSLRAGVPARGAGGRGWHRAPLPGLPGAVILMRPRAEPAAITLLLQLGVLCAPSSSVGWPRGHGHRGCERVRRACAPRNACDVCATPPRPPPPPRPRRSTGTAPSRWGARWRRCVAVIESQWVSKVLAVAGRLRPQGLNAGAYHRDHEPARLRFAYSSLRRVQSVGGC
jgi:hypothetical protein